MIRTEGIRIRLVWKRREKAMDKKKGTKYNGMKEEIRMRET